MTDQICFTDATAYERFMGTWSRMVGEQFLDWLAPPPGWRWLDVGCGSGAFTEMVMERCAPAAMAGLDPSPEQLAFARARPALGAARFHQGDAMALPMPDDAFDAAVMPLVLFFVPQPARGVSEMVRVVGPGGSVAGYVWDMPGGGFPYAVVIEELEAMGVAVPAPPSVEASRLEVMEALWAGAGLKAVETRVITVHRSFAGFDDYWTTILGGANVGPKLAAMAPADQEKLKARLRPRLTTDAAGRIACSARAHAVKGRVKG